MIVMMTIMVMKEAHMDDHVLQARRDWSVAEAKARLSEVMERAEHDGPQAITRNGKLKAYLVAAEDFHAVTEAAGARRETAPFGLATYLRNSPLFGADLDVVRDAGERALVVFD
jgi:prevent-host-death family protein